MDITIGWDNEACVWIASNSKIGLVLESGSYDALIERIKNALPDLMELNHTKSVTVVLKTKNRTIDIALE